MTLNGNEISKLFDFLLNNIKGRMEDELFNFDTLILLRKIMKDKENDGYFELSNDQEKKIISIFLNNNDIFDADTLSFIVTDKACINAAIKRDINSIDYVRFFSPELQKKVLKLALEKGYVLKSNSPSFLKNNYEVALNSIKINASSANYVNWDYMDMNEQDILVSETIKGGYILSEESSALLKNNSGVIVNSIALDNNSLLYADQSFRRNPEIFKRIIVSDNKLYSIDEIEKMPLSCYGDSNVMKSVLPLFMLYDVNDEEFVSKFASTADVNTFIDRLGNLYSMAINKVPKLSELNWLFKYIVVGKLKKNNNEEIDNICKDIFLKLEKCSILSYNEVLSSLENVQEVLGNKYPLLVKNIRLYYEIVHHDNKQISDTEVLKYQIIELIKLYYLRIYENEMKNCMMEYHSLLWKCFVPRMDNPVVCEKVVAIKKKNALKDLYKHNADLQFFNNLVKKYEKYFDVFTLKKIIDQIILQNCSNIGEYAAFSGKNSHFLDYKKSIEAKEMIKNLNKKARKYTNQELSKYKDYISYNETECKYYYSGPIFNFEVEMQNKKLFILEKHFNDLYNDIMRLANVMEVDESLTDDVIGYYQFLINNYFAFDDSSDLFPFTDDYYEFDKSVYDNMFTFKNFVISAIFNNGNIEPSSVLDDEAYSALCDYVIYNNLLLVFMLLNDENYLFSDDFNEEIVVDVMNSMKDLVNINKKYNVDISNIERVMQLMNYIDFSEQKDFKNNNHGLSFTLGYKK